MRLPKDITGVTLDAGFFIALEKGHTRALTLLKRGAPKAVSVAVPAGVLGQIWRGGSGAQVRIARALSSPEVEEVALNGKLARAIGMLCASTGTSDVVDASVVLCAQARGHHIATSDPSDMVRLDPAARLIEM